MTKKKQNKRKKKKKTRNKEEFIPFTRDWMFAAVTRDPCICKGLLEVILPDENIEKIEIATPENPIMDEDFVVTPEAALKFAEEIHGVRFENGLVPICASILMERPSANGSPDCRRQAGYEPTALCRRVQRAEALHS